VKDRATPTGLRKDGGAIIGMERQICLLDWSGEPQPICEVEAGLPNSRLDEDNVCPEDPSGVRGQNDAEKSHPRQRVIRTPMRFAGIGFES